MAKPSVTLTGHEVTFGHDEIIVSKTDPRGIITYANDVFLRVAGYTEAELLGQPHNIIRHPDMPRCVFELLWRTINSGQEIFAYVINRAKNGSHYWVFAHVTPTYNSRGDIVGHHSSRRVPYADALPKVKALYQQLCAIEDAAGTGSTAVAAGRAAIEATLAGAGISYSEFVFSLSSETCLEASA